MYRVNKLMYIVFVDLEKAFDSVNLEKLLTNLKDTNIDKIEKLSNY